MRPSLAGVNRLALSLNGPGGRYLIVGVLNTAVQLALFALALRLGWHNQLALGVSYAVAIGHSYLWNRWWTFRSSETVLAQLPKFLVVTFGNYALNAAMLALLVHRGMAPMPAQVLCLGVTTLAGYFAQRLWTFRR